MNGNRSGAGVVRRLGETRAPAHEEPSGLEGHLLDAALVRRAREGDLDAFEHLFERHHRRIHHLAFGLLHDTDDADDATQETFVRAFCRLAQLADARALHAWLTRIVVNLCRDRVRTFDARRTLSLDAGSGEDRQLPEVPDTARQPAEIAEAGELRCRVREAIAALAPEFREVIVLHDMEGLKLEEVAQALQVPMGTVKSRLSRGRAYLKTALTPYMYGIDIPSPPAGG